MEIRGDTKTGWNTPIPSFMYHISLFQGFWRIQRIVPSGTLPLYHAKGRFSIHFCAQSRQGRRIAPLPGGAAAAGVEKPQIIVKMQNTIDMNPQKHV